MLAEKWNVDVIVEDKPKMVLFESMNPKDTRERIILVDHGMVEIFEGSPLPSVFHELFCYRIFIKDCSILNQICSVHCSAFHARQVMQLCYRTELSVNILNTIKC